MPIPRSLLLHAFGKLGGALHQPGKPYIPGWPKTWPDPYRSIVLLSPDHPGGHDCLITVPWGTEPMGLVPTLLGPGVLLACNLLWAKADLLLFRSAG